MFGLNPGGIISADIQTQTMKKPQHSYTILKTNLDISQNSHWKYLRNMMYSPIKNPISGYDFPGISLQNVSQIPKML
jgi:hypothetical protein